MTTVGLLFLEAHVPLPDFEAELDDDPPAPLLLFASANVTGPTVNGVKPTEGLEDAISFIFM